ncbi:hypothetical protein E6P09_11050 [Haloferax mediterranei ATCC 33500]|uniref:DUF7973 domain-containing protein n=1 Tax=Haloferax mediterranei (strain ATCC 33500 / DSM 1411 / JCM 8866 / NBRC 14739 / NCIMB 2177 / R-4) TaxID=523841 RepID=I3R4Z9_HALMT|nr:hypothetical protein [Haloferax mediterranei]AFK19309.1 hypothetical protein HFX_1603 [Haloferax mediterranei ATCC 33500]AHZ21334.1 hypothetical protein BM92_01100 [Haloferax mediterranei ATCC 33500]EMA04502.1 hypothetical protein C439_02467 [Haloferax mediterranei ATCC 33500]MDX5989413.1 hypothetical protein [Haloferax mediterranei ATCC 33500]QCQ75777.1 hypothetical protein E6P09_11050 [Haloferax mediterranei ATCC 33500]
MALDQLWAIEMLIAAFAGGAFGAAIGALPAFIFTGFMVIAGEVASYVDADAGAITDAIAFGVPFSPAISFAGGAAAAAYAANRGYMDSGFDYHNAKDIGFALGSKPDVLAVGGIFGIIGYWLTVLSASFNMPYDHIAMGVTLSALIHRVAFGYDIVGKVRGSSLLDMTPFERGETRGGAIADGGEGGRLSVEPWLPNMYQWEEVTAIGIVVGIMAAYIALSTGSPFLAFGISAASLIFLNLGVERIPVTHHMSLPASTAALAYTAGATELGAVALLIGGVFGGISALFGEVFQRIFYAHGDTHWDPPAAAIVFGTFLVAMLAIAGVFPDSSWVATF